MSSKYVDTSAIIQVIGCVYNNPSLLDFVDRYTITEYDFAEDFHKIIFGAIYKLYENGAHQVTLNNIADFLSNRPKFEAIYQTQKGEEWILKASKSAMAASFDYYYGRLKKFSLLRAYESCGAEKIIAELYDPDNIFDAKKKQMQEEWLDNVSLQTIADKVDAVIDEVRMIHIDNEWEEAKQAGQGIRQLVANLKAHPEVGVPLYGPYVNAVTRGARLKKFYLRSAATGVGKTRAMIADVCYIACDQIYDDSFGWISAGISHPALLIVTEQDLSEAQTMMLAFISNVNEEHILTGEYVGDEEERVMKAAEIIERAPLYIEELPDFSLQDIENKIRKNIRDNGVLYVFNPKRVKGQ